MDLVRICLKVGSSQLDQCIKHYSQALMFFSLGFVCGSSGCSLR